MIRETIQVTQHTACTPSWCVSTSAPRRITNNQLGWFHTEAEALKQARTYCSQIGYAAQRALDLTPEQEAVLAAL